MKTNLIAILIAGLFLIATAFADDDAEYLQEVLPNGLIVIVKHNPDSRVFAVDILGKNRAAMEKPGQTGIIDFMNRMLVKGTKDKSAEEVQAALDDIGARLQTNDNPYIPYDDRYTWRAFTFLRFETIDDYAKDGIKLLYEIVAEPTFPPSEVEKMKGQVMGILGMDAGSTYKVCRNLYYKELFGKNPLSRPVLGDPQTVARFTSGDLEYQHRIFYNPPNLIMTIVSNLNPKDVIKMVKKRFKNLPPYPIKLKEFQIPDAGKVRGIQETSQPMDKEQAYIYLGNVVIGLKSKYSTALSVAVEILSSRLGLNLREKQGLAYSVGAGVRYLGDFGWYTCSIGTGYQNFDVAQEGILDEIKKLQTEPISRGELNKAVNSLWGSMLMRNMSCINQAYNMAYYEYVGVGYSYDDTYKERLDGVTTDDVQKVAQDYLDPENYVIAYVGKVVEPDTTGNHTQGDDSD